MSAFDRDDTELSASNTSDKTLNDQLAMINSAYARDDRMTCAALVESLYAFFDGAAA